MADRERGSFYPINFKASFKRSVRSSLRFDAVPVPPQDILVVEQATEAPFRSTCIKGTSPLAHSDEGEQSSSTETKMSHFDQEKQALT